jgi:hypothetical protein
MVRKDTSGVVDGIRGLSKSSPAWLGTPRFACSLFPLSKIGAEGFGGDEVREGGTSFAIACATGLSQG